MFSPRAGRDQRTLSTARITGLAHSGRKIKQTVVVLTYMFLILRQCRRRKFPHTRGTAIVEAPELYSVISREKSQDVRIDDGHGLIVGKTQYCTRCIRAHMRNCYKL